MTELSFLEAIVGLRSDQRAQFQRVVSRLLSGDVISPGDNPLAPVDPDWRFLERHSQLVEAYLSIAGWNVQYLAQQKFARAVHSQGHHRVRFTLLESLLACLCRQRYHEQMLDAETDGKCEISVGDIRERISIARKGNPPGKQLIEEAFKKLRKYGLVEFDSDFEADDYQLVCIKPLVEVVLSMEQVNKFVSLCSNESPLASSESSDVEESEQELGGDEVPLDGASNMVTENV
jgi:hypothetical protein